MRIKKYGIELVRLAEKDIELIRQKRNSDAIRKTMLYQEIITPEMQKKWFESIDNLKNWYFIVEVDGQKLGLIHGKVFEEKEGRISFEGGVFFWGENVQTPVITTASSIVLTDFAFYLLKQKSIYAKVMKHNLSSLNYNKMMGFEVINECQDYYEMLLTFNSYKVKIEKVRETLFRFGSDESELKLEDVTISHSFRKKILSNKKEFQSEFSDALTVLANYKRR